MGTRLGVLLSALSCVLTFAACDSKQESLSPTGIQAEVSTEAKTKAPLILTPGSLSFTAVGAEQAQSVSVIAKFAGLLTVSTSPSCEGIVTASPSATRAVPGKAAAFSVTPVANGACNVTVTDKKGNIGLVAVSVEVVRFTQPFTIASDVASGNDDSENPGKLGALAVGQNVLLVSCRTLGSPLGIFGTIIDPIGQVLQSFPISEDADCAFPRPSVASDGSGFLVVFQRHGEIIATRLSGAPEYGVLGESVISTGTSNFFPGVAFGGSGYLVVWAKYRDYPNNDYDIFGAKVGTGGQASTEIPIFVQHPGEQVEPSIAFDGVNYLVIWRDTRTGSGPTPDTDIYGTRVSVDGTVLDPTGIPISTAPNYQGEPNLTFGGTNYFAVWLDARQSPPETQPPLAIFGTRISPTGTLLDGPANGGGIAISTATVAPSTLQYVSAAFDGSDYMVAFAVVGLDPPAGIYSKRVSTNGVVLDGPPDQLGVAISGPPPSGSQLVYPTIASTGVRSFVAWVSVVAVAGEAKDIVGAIIEKAAEILGVPAPLLMSREY